MAGCVAVAAAVAAAPPARPPAHRSIGWSSSGRVAGAVVAARTGLGTCGRAASKGAESSTPRREEGAGENDIGGPASTQLPLKWMERCAEVRGLNRSALQGHEAVLRKQPCWR